MFTRNNAAALFVLLVLLIPAGCGGGGSSSYSFEVNNSTGTLSMSMTDAPTEDYNAVYVTVDSVWVHSPGGGWREVADPDRTCNLLDLINGTRMSLGMADLDPGRYTQMRLIVGSAPEVGLNLLSEPHPFANYIVDKTNGYHELKVPGGTQSGVKIIHGFTISSRETTELILDFDAAKSVVKAGNSGKWLLKPVIRVLTLSEASLLAGTVLDTGLLPLGGVRVTAQHHDPGAIDPKDRVAILASTITGTAGDYESILLPGTFQVVAYKTGYEAAARTVTAQAGTVLVEDFTLTTASTGSVAGSVTIAGGGAEQYGTLSFRQTVQPQGGSGSVEIELKEIHIADGGTYSVDLPDGGYTVVASTFDRATQEHTVTVTAGSKTPLDVVL